MEEEVTRHRRAAPAVNRGGEEEEEQQQQLLLGIDNQNHVQMVYHQEPSAAGSGLFVAVPSTPDRPSWWHCGSCAPGDAADAPTWYDLYDTDAMPLLLHGRLRPEVYAASLEGLHELYRRYVKVYVWAIALIVAAGGLGAVVLASVVLDLNSPIRIFFSCLAITFALVAIIWGCLNPRQYKKQRQAYLDKANAQHYHRLGLHLHFARVEEGDAEEGDEQLVIDIRPESYGTLPPARDGRDNAAWLNAAARLDVIQPTAYRNNPPYLV